MFDIIGDIHGHASALKRLLAKLGYQQGQDRLAACRASSHISW